MTAIFKRMRAGFNGGVSRDNECIREPRYLATGGSPHDYGYPVKLNADGTMTALAASDVATAIHGLLVRPFPTMDYGAPKDEAMHDVMVQGYMTVVVVSGTVVAKGQVYIRNTAADDHFIGEVSADNPTGTIALTGAYFTGPASAGEDGDLVAEIAYKIY